MFINKKNLLIILLSILPSLYVHGMEVEGEKIESNRTPKSLNTYKQKAAELQKKSTGELIKQGAWDIAKSTAAGAGAGYATVRFNKGDNIGLINYWLPYIYSSLNAVKTDLARGDIKYANNEIDMIKRNLDDITYLASQTMMGETKAALIGTVAGGGLALIKTLNAQFISADPQWEKELKKLDETNISNGTMLFSGKQYVLAKKFDDKNAVVYYQQEGHEGYEIHIMVDPLLAPQLFINLQKEGTGYEKWADSVSNIAIMGLRPTPRIYDTSGITGKILAGTLTGDILARIIIVLKPGAGQGAGKDGADALVAALYNYIKDTFINDKDVKEIAQKSIASINDLNPKGYWPNYTAKLTPESNILFGRFNSITYAKNNKRAFDSKGYFRTHSDDFAYPKDFTAEQKLAIIKEIKPQTKGLFGRWFSRVKLAKKP